MHKLLSILSFLFVTAYTYAQDTTSVTIHNAASHIGKEATICEKVSTIVKSETNKNIYINFGGKYPDHKFTVVIFPKDQLNFKYDPVLELKDKIISVSGIITEYKGKPQIIAKVSTQISVQE